MSLHLFVWQMLLSKVTLESIQGVHFINTCFLGSKTQDLSIAKVIHSSPNSFHDMLIAAFDLMACSASNSM